MPSKKRKFGNAGETIAAHYLNNKGYEVIGTNYLKPWGEIDIIAKKKDMLVFCEVKTRERKHVEHYLAEASVNRSKIRKLQKICETYLLEKRYPIHQKWQIDVISVAVDKENKKALVKHFENVVWERVY